MAGHSIRSISHVSAQAKSFSARSRRHTPFLQEVKSETEYEHLPDYSLPPWPVWSDAELNHEHWDEIHRPTRHNFHDEHRPTSVSPSEHLRFEDPLGHIELPPSLQPDMWIRLDSLPLMAMFHTNSTTAPILDLTTPNTHLLHSEVMRWIIAGIMNLHQLGRAHTVELEGQEKAFHIESRKWKPWHHIYALCKVTKHSTHIPHVNPYGKYVVRLFYMGCWRRITIDDYIPLDSHSRPLLPMSASGREMWPALLSKALLKVAALSWTPEKEILDFSVMACLTGWHAQELDLTAVPSRTIWWLCQKLLSADCDDPEDRFTGVKTVSARQAYGSASCSRDSIDLTEAEFSDPAAEVIGSVVLCAVVQTPSPSIEHPVLITQAKVNTLNTQGEDRPPTPLWKTFRWKKWALEQGLIVDTSEKHVKCIRMYSPLLKCQPDMEQADRISSIRDMSIMSEEDKLTGLIPPKIQSPPTIQSLPKSQSPQERKPASHRRRTRAPPVLEDTSDLITSERSISTHKQEKVKTPSHATPENKNTRTKDQQAATQSKFPEFWIKFEKLAQCMKRFEIYYRTKSFAHNLNVTDISHISQEKKNTARKTATGKRKFTDMSHTSHDKHSPRKKHSEFSKMDDYVRHSSSSAITSKTERNKECLGDNTLYLLIDSMADKKLLFSLSVLNPPMSLHVSPHSLHSVSHHKLPPSIASENPHDEEEETHQKIPPTYYIQGECYDWQSPEIEDITFEVKTVATTCHLIQLGEGLRVFRLWMKLPEVYALRISSQTPFVLGTREMIQEKLSEYSTSWKQYGSNFSHAFNELVKIHKTSAHHEELLENLHKSYLPPQIPKPSSKFAARLRRKIFTRFEKTFIELLVKHTSDHDVITQVVSEWQWLFQKEKFGSRITITTREGEVLEMHWSRASHITENIPSAVCSLHTIKTTASPSEATSHTGDHPHDTDESYELLSLGKQKKNLSFDQQAGIIFLRKMFSGEPEILRYYPFRNDDKHHIHFTDYQGIASTFGQNWIPLVRFVVNVHENQNPYCAVYLTTTVPHDVIQVTNNDTLTQYPRLLGDIQPAYFPYNRHGYTIFAYGFEDQHKDHYWKVRLLTFAEQQLPHSCHWSTTETCSPEEPPSLVIKEVKGNYIPNRENVIFKCLLTLDETQILTLRTVMSNSNAEFVLKITWEDGDVIAEYKGYGELTIPVLRLEGRDSGGPDFFRIEAQVLGNTWSLNSEEMDIILNLKEKALRDQMVFSDDLHPTRSKSTRRRLKMLHRDESHRETRRSEMLVNAPFWSLMLVVDQDLSSTVFLEKDKRRVEEIQHLKTKWERDDPGRSQRGSRIRHEFLTQERYSAHLRGFIHEQGIGYGEKTKFLLEYLSCRESEYKLERKKVMQERRESESKLGSNKVTEHDRQDENRRRIEEFQEEYEKIKNQFRTIKEDQMMRNRRNQDRLATASTKSKMMKAEAYAQRNNCVELIKIKIKNEKENRESIRRSRPSNRRNSHPRRKT